MLHGLLGEALEWYRKAGIMLGLDMFFDSGLGSGLHNELESRTKSWLERGFGKWDNA